MTPTPTGNVPVDAAARVFTLQDIAYLTRVTVGSIRNWRFRGIVTTIGRKDNVTGRWFFSLEDGLHLSVMRALCLQTGLDFGPKRGAVIAALVVSTARENLARPSGEYRTALNIVVGWDETGEQFAVLADIRNAGHYHPEVRETDGAVFSPMRQPVVCIPAAAMLSDLIIRTEFLQLHNKRAEAPTHA